MSKTDTLPAEKKNKKEMEFELKLAREKEEILEREKQMKINRLLQEVPSSLKCHYSVIMRVLFCWYIIREDCCGICNELEQHSFYKGKSVQWSV